MEDDFNILKVEYLSLQPPMEDDLKIYKVENLSNHCMDRDL